MRKIELLCLLCAIPVLASCGSDSTPGQSENQAQAACEEYALEISTSADLVFTRAFEWDIQKRTDQPAVTLGVGETATVAYTVAVTPAHLGNRGYSVEGFIEIDNPSPIDATVSNVTEVVDAAFTGIVSCGQTFPATIAAGAGLECSFIAQVPGGAAVEHVACVETTGLIGGACVAAPVIVTSEIVRNVDNCVNVVDDQQGFLGAYCAYGPQPDTFAYTRQVGPYEACGTFDVVNVACLETFTEPESPFTNSPQTRCATATVTVTVPCDQHDCTLTPGYWKNHSAYGPAPADDTWTLLPQGPDTAFFLSGQTYLEVLRTSPSGGNAYYILARAYIAAELNHLAGAPLGGAGPALAQATALFQQYPPSTLATLAGGGRLRQQFIALAGTLDRYNNGLLGVPHCSDSPPVDGDKIPRKPIWPQPILP